MAVVSADPEANSPAASTVQQGVLKARNVHNYWTKKGAIIAYVGLFATTFIIYLEIYATIVYIPFVTSEFASHSLLAAAGIVQNIADVAAYPIVAKLSDVFGRAEGIALSILFLVLSNVLAAAAQNIDTYVSSNIFEAAGVAGFTIMQQVFIADTTKLVNRGIWASLVEAVSAIPVLYIGTTIGENMLTHSTWRWGYAMWCIILPVAALPLIIILHHYQGRRGQDGERQRPTFSQRFASLLSSSSSPSQASFSTLSEKVKTVPRRIYRLLWIELDLPGAILLVAALALILVPLSITGPFNVQRWNNASTIAMLVVGALSAVAFFVWDARFARHPFIPYRSIRERTIIAAYLLAILDWMGYAMLATFLSSHLQVAGGLSPGEAARVDNAGRVTFQVASVFVGLLMRWTKRSQVFVLVGVCINVLSQGLMIYMVNVDGNDVANQASLVTARVLSGIGRGLFSTASQVSCQALVPQQDVAVVTGVFLAMMSIGSAIGRSIAGAIWNSHLPRNLATHLPASSQDTIPEIFGSFVAAMEQPMGNPIRDAINTAYRQTTQVLAIGGTATMAAMLIVMFFMKNVDLEAADEERRRELEDTSDAKVAAALEMENERAGEGTDGAFGGGDTEISREKV